jgi:ABC-type dipeptide/oligopeptide/nickel transport system permease subunit
LGIFNVFIGGTIIQPDRLSGPIYMPRIYEWSGLIGFYKEYIFSSYPWIIVFPLLAYFGFLITLHIMLKGFEMYFRKKIRQVSVL